MQGLVDVAKTVHDASLIQAIEDESKHRRQRFWLYGIQQAADVIVGRDFERAKRGLHVVFALRILHRSLMLQK